MVVGAAKSHEDAFEDNPPEPAATIESLRALGYSCASAIADLVDNAIAASARTIAVTLQWAGPQSWCAVVDDGKGMDEDQLKVAMRIGSIDPLAARPSDDLGRFGFGLKTASFSQARELTVVSGTFRRPGPWVRAWDLDHVRDVRRWEMRKNASAEVERLLRKLNRGKRGTAVVWTELTNIVPGEAAAYDEAAHSAFLHTIKEVERHLSATFGRYLIRSEKLLLTINGAEVRPWDPFLIDHPATQRLPAEDLRLHGAIVRVTPYVLPHSSKLDERARDAAGGPHGWNAQQGFYVYRRDRLITAGDWLALQLTRDDPHNLARIAIEFGPDMDQEWQLNIVKSTVHPPAALRSDLRRIAVDVRRRAKRAYFTRAGVTLRNPTKGPAVPVWQQNRARGHIKFRINRSHPLLQQTLHAVGPARKLLLAALHIIEETVPKLHAASPAVNEPPESNDNETIGAVFALVEAVYENLLKRGRTRSEAKAELLKMEPFNLYPDIVERVTSPQ